MQKWGLGERAAQKYVAEARRAACVRAPASTAARSSAWRSPATRSSTPPAQGRRPDRNARTTLDKLVALLGLGLPTRERPITLAALDAEIARLKAELAALEEQAP